MFRKNCLALLCLCFGGQLQADPPKPLKLLFLGDNGHHKPAERFRQIQPVLAKRGIDVVYTDAMNALTPRQLAGYDGLIVYANIDKIEKDQEKALLDFVAAGKGFIPLHCASYCFRNSDPVVALIGAQFLRHGTGTFRTTIANADHPIMKGYRGFESWDETYVHTKHNDKDRTVLEYRVDGANKEPWTWVRTHGKGRVFYTAWGHDERTWGHAGFQSLIERGIRWACGQDPTAVPPYVDRPEMTKLRKDVKPFEYVDAKIPFYPPSRQWGVTAQPLSKMQKPLPSDESIKHFVTPVDFEVKLFVDETKLGGGKPICMNWDERGRLFVALTYDYPNERQPEGQGRDRIVICEDTTGAGVCDKVTVFADKLSIPTSILPYAGGLIVHQAPHTLFLKDTKGDGKADFRQVLFTGWGTGDTHAGPSNLRYGLDNWIYGMVGYSAFRGEVAGERVDFRQGFYRFKVEPVSPQRKQGDHSLKVTKLEFLRSTSNNSWGVGISEEGYLFGSTANGCPSVFMPIPNRYYEKVRGLTPSVLKNIAPDNHFEPITEKVRQVDWHGGFTAAAGSAIYTARNYPREYWNRIQFVCEPTGHLVAMFELTPNGADFKARYFGNLLASDDEWSAPIMAEVGPDGNVWVIDWYNYIVQHNPTPPGWRTGKGAAYETDLRDKKHGRIYRVVPKTAKPLAALQLNKATPQQLVETLKNDNMFWRLQAQRLLVERGKMDVGRALWEMVEKDTTYDTALNVGGVHAQQVLWGLFSNGIKSDQWEPGGHDYRQFIDDYRNARKEFAKAQPQFQLRRLLWLADVPNYLHIVVDELGRLLTNEHFTGDPVMRDALICAYVAQRHSMITVFATAKPMPQQSLEIVRIVAENYAAQAFYYPEDNTIPNQTLVFLANADPKVAEAMVIGFARGWPKDRRFPVNEEGRDALKKLLKTMPAQSRGTLLRLVAHWGVKDFDTQLTEISKSLFTTIADAKSAEDARIAAAKQLIEVMTLDAAMVDKLLGLITPSTSPAFATGVIEALGSSESPAVAPALVKRLATWPPSARTAAVRALLGRVESTRELLGALDKGEVQMGELSLEQKQALLTHSQRDIRARAKTILSRSGGLPDPDRQKVIEQYISVTKKTGDPVAGKLIFKNNCAKCHKHSGEGESIGPDLTGMAVHSKEHLLVDILDPSRNVEGNFRIYRVELKDGRSLSGLLAAETRTSIELIDAEAKRHAVQRSDIEELQASNKSLMPEGFEKTVKPEDLVNLLEFLTQKGKYLPIPLDKAATIVSTKGMFYSEDAYVERLIFRDWTPKTFEGVPFVLIDPRGDKINNVIMLNGPTGTIPPKMPRAVTLPCNSAAKTIHFLSGISGWGYQGGGGKGSLTMIVRLHYEDGKTEDHELKNGEHFADYIRRVDVPQSKFAFALRGQQVRYLTVTPKRPDIIKEIELVKGTDATAPVVMAVTVERP